MFHRLLLLLFVGEIVKFEIQMKINSLMNNIYVERENLSDMLLVVFRLKTQPIQILI
jgi:hypothetical protein